MIWQKDGGNTVDWMNSCLDDHTAYLRGLIQVEKKRMTLQHLPSKISAVLVELCWFTSIFQAPWWHGQATWLVVPPSWTCFTVLSTIKNVRHEALKFVGVQTHPSHSSHYWWCPTYKQHNPRLPNWLVVSTPLKKSQWEVSSHILWKIKLVATTN